MKLTAEVSGERHEVELRREGARVTARVGEREYELEAREVEAGIFLLTHEGRVYECRVGRVAGGGGGREVALRGRTLALTLIDPKRLRGGAGADADAGGRAEVRAPMPGKVVRVLVEAGAEVEAGAGLVVVEAMKMQNELKSPKAGHVSALHARNGATVNAGDVLVVIE